MSSRSSLPPLNGAKTHPLSQHALGELLAIASHPKPSQEVNPGVVNRLLREELVEVVALRSPYKAHRGRDVNHLRITDAGRATLERKYTKVPPLP